MIGKCWSKVVKKGEWVVFFSVTYYVIGRVVDVDPSACLVEAGAAWAGDMGRLTAALTTGSIAEWEIWPDQVVVAESAVVLATPWRHGALPQPPKAAK